MAVRRFFFPFPPPLCLFRPLLTLLPTPSRLHPPPRALQHLDGTGSCRAVSFGIRSGDASSLSFGGVFAILRSHSAPARARRVLQVVVVPVRRRFPLSDPPRRARTDFFDFSNSLNPFTWLQEGLTVNELSGLDIVVRSPPLTRALATRKLTLSRLSLDAVQLPRAPRFRPSDRSDVPRLGWRIRYRLNRVPHQPRGDVGMQMCVFFSF